MSQNHQAAGNKTSLDAELIKAIIQQQNQKLQLEASRHCGRLSGRKKYHEKETCRKQFTCYTRGRRDWMICIYNP
jgi:hypothetical protein